MIAAELPTGPGGLESNNFKWSHRCSRGLKPALISNLVMLKKEGEGKKMEKKAKSKNANQKNQKYPIMLVRIGKSCWWFQ